MKIIQAMKRLKDLKAKEEDLRDKVGRFCADLTLETATYPDQKQQIREWIQAQHDILKEILDLRLAIQRTNLATSVSIELYGKTVTKNIAAWVHRRKDLAGMEMAIWQKLGDRGLKEQNVQTSQGGPITEIRIRRYFDPSEKDRNVELYRSEPMVIDAILEVINATTEVVME